MDLEKSTATSEAKAPLPEQGARRDDGGGGGVDMMAAATMVLLQLFNTGMVLLSKVSISGGMFIFALLTYRSLFGAAVILPLALLRERGKWKEMHWHAAGRIFLNAFIGYAVPNGLAYYGLQDTTASYAIIFLNIIPLTTFILSILFRMEAFRFRSTAGSLKIAGVLLSVGGAMIISLYKGKILHLWHPIFHVHNKEQVDAASHQLRGAMLLAGSSFMFASWYLIQPKVLKVYPYKYWSSMWTCLVGGFQTALAGVVVQRNKKAWRIGWDINLVTIVYSGALVTAARYSLTSWAVSKKGPSYPPMFNPLSVVFTVMLGSIFIGDVITIGSLVGTTLVIVGTYIFLWAKDVIRPTQAVFPDGGNGPTWAREEGAAAATMPRGPRGLPLGAPGWPPQPPPAAVTTTSCHMESDLV